MVTQLAAYDAAPQSSPAPAPMAVYLVENGVPTEIAGVDDFDITVANPTTERADASELDITLEYDPANPQHQTLLNACDSGGSSDADPGTVTVRIATRNPRGAAVACREMDCAVVRYRMSMDDRFRDDAKSIRVSLVLEGVGEVRDIG